MPGFALPFQFRYTKKTVLALSVNLLLLCSVPSLKLAQLNTPDSRLQYAVPSYFVAADSPPKYKRYVLEQGVKGELYVSLVKKGQQLDGLLSELRWHYPDSVPGPPETIEVPGVRQDLGHRATRFVISGSYQGEMVMIEKSDQIVLFVTLVPWYVWRPLKKLMLGCYASATLAPTRS